MYLVATKKAFQIVAKGIPLEFFWNWLHFYISKSLNFYNPHLYQKNVTMVT